MRKTTTWIVIVLSWALWLGCLYDPYDYESSPGGDTASTGAYSVEAGWMAGDVPTVGNFEGDAYEIEASSYAVTLHTGERGGDHDGWAMTRLYVDMEDIASATEMTTVEATSATGCSGPSHGDWDWDTSTTDVTVTVQPGATEDQREVYFESDFGGETQTQGGFTVNVR